MPKISRKDIDSKLTNLLSSEKGIITVLAATLIISDFDDPTVAIIEATKTYNSNQAYFKRIIEKWKSK